MFRILVPLLLSVALVASQARAQSVGQTFRDCPKCPEMVVVPAGSFIMGSNEETDAKPAHKVTIAKPFAVGKYEVTFDEWDACVADGGCKHKPGDIGWGRSERPVINVSWDDISKQYLPWLKRKTGKTYRLLSEAEWEYTARAETATKFSWGNDVGKGNANCSGCGSEWDAKQTAPVGSFKANAFGLHDMHGNVWEWSEDCWHENYNSAPDNGKAWTSGNCSRRVLRGGSWLIHPRNLGSAYRFWKIPDFRSYYAGFRVGRMLTP